MGVCNSWQYLFSDMMFSAENLAEFDMAMSIPADDLNACVEQAVLGIAQGYPNARLPSADWVLKARATELGIAPVGQRSANRSCHLMACEDGWLAINLARDSDWTLLNAWLETDVRLTNWSVLRTALVPRCGRDLLGRGREMGMPLAFVDTDGSDTDEAERPAALMTPDGLNTAGRSLQGAKVVDLSALWAGPLCAHLLHRCGAQVTSIASIQRPDGSRQGNPALYQQLHAGHEHLALDFDDADQRKQLAYLLAGADVVIEASRPRALRQLGLDRESLNISRPQIWLSITAYGRKPPADQWAGFGDDVAVSAGLLHWDDLGHPHFVGDAIADPLTGVYGALAVVESMARGRSGLLDVSMAGIARQCRQKILAAGQDVICPLLAATSC